MSYTSNKQVFEAVASCEIPERVEQAIVGSMDRLFPYIAECPPQNCNGTDVPEAIHDALSGVQPLRIKKAPQGEAKERNLARIEAMVAADMPIPLMMLVGTAKFPDGSAEQNTADLADFGAIQTAIALDKRVRAVYPNGVSVRAYYEDFVGDWLFGDQCWPAQETYFDSLKQLHKDAGDQFGHNPIHFVREQDIMSKLGVDLSQFRDRADGHRIRFEEYLTDSEEVLEACLARTPYESWEEARNQLKANYPEFLDEVAGGALRSLPSFKALQEHGWEGIIPPEMREFYLRRFAQNVNGIAPNRAARLAYMARYYGSTLVKAQLRSPATEMDGIDEAHNYTPQVALKLALLGLAPGIPTAFQDAYQMRAIANLPKRGGVDNSTAPWRCVGGILVRECKTQARVNVTSSANFNPDEHVPADLQLTSGGTVRAPIQFREPAAS